eukprot:scaffold106146_cov69-Phaeocystis_antarctica.AAC.4
MVVTHAWSGPPRMEAWKEALPGRRGEPARGVPSDNRGVELLRARARRSLERAGTQRRTAGRGRTRRRGCTLAERVVPGCQRRLFRAQGRRRLPPTDLGLQFLGGLHELRHLLREKVDLRVALLQLLLQLCVGEAATGRRRFGVLCQCFAAPHRGW